jgi:hypothetical protein
MADVLSMLREQGQQFLEPGEQVLAAFQAKPRGSGVATGGVGLGAQAVGGVWSRKSRDAASGAGLELTSPMVLALTDRRVAVFGGDTSMGSGKFTAIRQLVSSVPVGEVQSVQVKRLLVGKTVTLALQGGEVKLEVPGGQDPKPFAEEFERIRSGS